MDDVDGLWVVDIVTGATQGIGLAIAEYIAERREEQERLLSSSSSSCSSNKRQLLVLVGRNRQRGLKAVETIQQKNMKKEKRKNSSISILFDECDVSDYKNVIRLKNKIMKRINDCDNRRSNNENDGNNKDHNIGENFKSNNSDDNCKDKFQVGILVNNAAECPVEQKFVYRRKRKQQKQTQKQKQKQSQQHQYQRKRKQQENDGNEEDETVERFNNNNNNDNCDDVDLHKLDCQFATNVLGYHFMMKVFSNNFARNNDNSIHRNNLNKTFVVNIASTWAGDLDLNDLQFEKRPYDNDTAYRQSKQCNRMLSHIWSNKIRRLPSSPSYPSAQCYANNHHDQNNLNVVINSCHPSDPCTKLSTDLGYNMYSPSPSTTMIEKETSIPYLCGFELKNNKTIEVSGKWFSGCGGSSNDGCSCPLSKNERTTEQLYEICDEYCCE